MTNTIKTVLPALTISCALLLAAGFAVAQDYPVKPVRWIVPFPAGGGGDILIRAVAQRLGERLGQPVLVDNGAVAPAGVPAPIIDRLNRELVSIVRLPDMVEKLAAQGADPMSNTPAEFSAYIRSEIGKWQKVVRQAGIKLQ